MSIQRSISDSNQSMTREVQTRACMDGSVAGESDETKSSGWQPIETAPKDGTRVDLYGSRSGKPRRFTNAWWAEDCWGGQLLGTHSWCFDQRDVYGKFEFTHWMPLPAPPAVAETRRTESAGSPPRAVFSDPLSATRKDAQR